MDRPPTTANASRPPRPSAGRRAAAAGALIALLAVAVVVGWSVIRNPLQLLLALLLIILVALAGWTALLHHGLKRLLAAIVAVAALAGLLALPDVRSLMLIVVVAGLVLIATAAARVAIGRDLALTGGARQVGPARHGVLLLNPWSGGGKVTRFGLADKARERGVTPIVLHRGDDLHTLAVEAAESGADVLGMAGGDGSQALVADVARRHGIPFVCVPAGTRNHFALDLGLNRADVAAALDAFGEAIERRVDLATVGGRVFVNNASLGVYATVVQSDGYRDAKMSTTARLLPELLGPDADRPDLRFTRPDGANVQTADVVLVSNGAYRLDSLNGFGSRARLDGGVLGVVTVTVNRARDLPALVSAETTRHLDRFPGYREWTAPEFRIDSGHALVDVAIDGEALQLRSPLRFRSLPAALRVRTPVHAPGLPPAAVAPPGVRRTVTVLFRVLAGGPAR